MFLPVVSTEINQNTKGTPPLKSVESADSSLRSRCVAIRFAATTSVAEMALLSQCQPFFLNTEREREVWLDENRFKFGLPDPPAAHRCKKVVK